MPETSGAAGGLGQLFDRHELDVGDALDHELRDAIASRDGHRLGAVVDDDDPHLAAVVGVDRPRAVQERDARAQGQAASRADLRLEAGRHRDRDAGRNQRPPPRRNDHRIGDARPQVEAGRVARRAGGEREIGGFGKAPEVHHHSANPSRIALSVRVRPTAASAGTRGRKTLRAIR